MPEYKNAEAEAMPQRDWTAIAHWIRDEKERRAGSKKRRDLVKMWDEVDRQVAMEPLPKVVTSGNRTDWLPDVELPLQFNALEVNCADARRLKFPRGSEWYAVSANISAEYEARFQSRRERFPMVGGIAAPMQMNQETANTLVKATMDFYHKKNDFRANIDLWDVEILKYGTGVLRTKKVLIPKFFNDYRGTKSATAQGPATVAVPIRSVYPDDTPPAVMQEGITVAPGTIRCGWKKLYDIKNAIKLGGPERGYRAAAVKRLVPDKSFGENELIEWIEFEGDLIVPRNSGNPIFLPGCVITIAVGKNMNEVIRYQENEYPFPTYDFGYYMRDALDSPYGTSPLIKGQPIQEAATLALNQLLAVGALEAQRPCFYDRNDPGLSSKGGPLIYPGAMNPVDSPEAMNFMEGGEIAALLNTYLALLKQYEDLTAVNDPRRGGATKSHTTATAVDIEQSRGMARTDDFVQGQLYGPIPSVLYKHFDIIKSVTKTPQSIRVDQGGVEGWVQVASADLPDEIAADVFGAAGLINERQAFENFSAATNMALQYIAGAVPLAQAGLATLPSVDVQQVILETYRKAGFNGAGRLFPPPAASPDVSAGAAGGAELPPGAPGIPTNNLAQVQAALGV